MDECIDDRFESIVPSVLTLNEGPVRAWLDENIEKGAKYLGVTVAIFLGIRLLRVALWLPGEC